MRRFLPASALGALLLGTAVAGCLNLSPRAPRTSPYAPGLDAARVAEATRQAAAARPAFLDAALRRARTQPLRLGKGPFVRLGAADSAAMGYVAGQYPLRAQELVVVAVPVQADAAALGAWAELARAYGRLAGPYVFPERTMLFAALPGDPVESLARFLDGADWPADAVAGVLVMGLPANADGYLDAMLAARGIPRLVAPARTDAFALAQDTYTALWPSLYATGAPSDSLLTRDSLAALRSDTVLRTVPAPRPGWRIHKY